jgi:hypothetical protein
VFGQIVKRIQQLYKSRAFLIHYTSCGATTTELEEAKDMVEFLISEYEGMRAELELPPRPRIIV